MSGTWVHHTEFDEYDGRIDIRQHPVPHKIILGLANDISYVTALLTVDETDLLIDALIRARNEAI